MKSIYIIVAVLLLLPLASAEIKEAQFLSIDSSDNQTLNYITTISLSDNPETYDNTIINTLSAISELYQLRMHTITFTFPYHVEALPYDFSTFYPSITGSVDYCNFSITGYHNIYENNILVNTTITSQSVYFGTNASSVDGTLAETLFYLDRATAKMSCHYTTPETVFLDHALIGIYQVKTGSFSCLGCNQQSLEQLSNGFENSDKILQSSLSTYSTVQTAVEKDVEIWLIISWIIKIGFVVLAVVLAFSVGYFYYKLIKRVFHE